MSSPSFLKAEKGESVGLTVEDFGAAGPFGFGRFGVVGRVELSVAEIGIRVARLGSQTAGITKACALSIPRTSRT